MVLFPNSSGIELENPIANMGFQERSPRNNRPPAGGYRLWRDWMVYLSCEFLFFLFIVLDTFANRDVPAARALRFPRSS
jgi:hypothetical protein